FSSFLLNSFRKWQCSLLGWSGRASQEGLVEVAVSGLASMYTAFGWVCPEPSWKSARLRSHYRTDLSGPFGSPVLAGAGKTDPPSRLILSQTSAGSGDYINSGSSSSAERSLGGCRKDLSRLEVAPMGEISPACIKRPGRAPSSGFRWGQAA